MPKSNKQLKEELARKEKLNSEMEKQIKRNDKYFEKVKKDVADRLEKN